MLSLTQFKKKVWDYYEKNRRDFPWRNARDPYRILVSEIMLQQTQVSRVLLKYKEFIKVFPTFKALARASNEKVFSVWQGMGYNRRVLYLKSIAEIVTHSHEGKLPNDEVFLKKLPGIGDATAGAIIAFAFNKPSVFIETNIRRVFIHFFFPDKKSVRDKDILKLVEKTLDMLDPREWYYALMDYGAMLAKTSENPNRKSAHYKIQSIFSGSQRQVRGEVLKYLLSQKKAQRTRLFKKISFKKDKIRQAITALTKEGFIHKEGDAYRIK